MQTHAFGPVLQLFRQALFASSPHKKDYATGVVDGLPLAGVRIVDLTGGQAGPLATMLLGDLGADVVKDKLQGQWGLRVTPTLGNGEGESTFFLGVNRNKRSVALDVDDPNDLSTIRRLIARSDVVVSDYTSSVALGRGLDYATTLKENNRMIYCSITGYGQSGPYRNAPSSDGILAAESGIAFCTGQPTRNPVRPQVAPTDHITAYYAYGAVMAALMSRDRTGAGVYVDVAGLEVQLASMGNVGGSYLNAGIEYTRIGTAHPTVVPYEVFATFDGCLMIGAGNNSQFEKFSAAIGHNELPKDPRFCTNPLRVKNRSILVPILQDILQ